MAFPAGAARKLPRVKVWLSSVGALIALLATAAPAQADRTISLTAGPYRLGPFETVRPKEYVRTPSVDGYITRMHARLVDRNGRPVSIRHVMLHHVVFLNRGRFAGDRKPKCGARFGEPFYGTGEENQALELPDGFGYRSRPDDLWKMQTMLMSHTPAAKRVYVEYTMTLSERRAGARHALLGADDQLPQRAELVGPRRRSARLRGPQDAPVARPGGRPARGRRRASARRRLRHDAAPAVVPRPAPDRVQPVVRPAAGRDVQRPADPARARADEHGVVHVAGRHPGPRRRPPARDRRLRRHAPPHGGDGRLPHLHRGGRGRRPPRGPDVRAAARCPTTAARSRPTSRTARTRRA